MRSPEVAVASASRSSSTASPARSRSSIHIRASTSAPAPPLTGDAGSGGWSLPPLNQFMTLPSRFMPSSFGASLGSSAGTSPSTVSSSSGTGGGGVTASRSTNAANDAAVDNLLNDEDEDWAVHDHFVLPHNVQFHDMFDINVEATGPAHPPEEIDLTVSSSEDEDSGQNAAGVAGDSDDTVEILDVSDAPQPTPLRRKRRRPVAAVNGTALLVPKRQRMTDKMRSAESTDISIQNSEVVEEFKRRLKCSVCLDVLEDMTSTLCGHIFCAACIHQAIRANGRCPLCKRHLHLKDTHRLFF